MTSIIHQLPKDIKRSIGKVLNAFIDEEIITQGKTGDTKYKEKIIQINFRRLLDLLSEPVIFKKIINGDIIPAMLFHSLESDLNPDVWEEEFAWKGVVEKDRKELESNRQYIKCRKCGGPCLVRYLQTRSCDEGAKAFVVCSSGCR